MQGVPGPSQPGLHGSVLISLFGNRRLSGTTDLLDHLQGFSFTLDHGAHSTSLTQIFKDVFSLIL